MVYSHVSFCFRWYLMLSMHVVIVFLYARHTDIHATRTHIFFGIALPAAAYAENFRVHDIPLVTRQALPRSRTSLRFLSHPATSYS